MQIAAAPTRPTAAAPVLLASQTIDISAKPLEGGGTVTWETVRELRIAGAHEGIDTFTNADDAIAAARALSRGEMPGLAVVSWRGGFRVYDVHTASRTYRSTSTHAPISPTTTELRHSSVPFAAGNIRQGVSSEFTPAVVRNEDLVALVDGEREFRAGTKASAGRPPLVETTSGAQA